VNVRLRVRAGAQVKPRPREPGTPLTTRREALSLYRAVRRPARSRHGNACCLSRAR
jgi:hypothetical protein